MEKQSRKNENPFANLLINIFLPVFILNQSAKWEFDNAALIGLVLGLIPPLGYGIWDWLKNHNRNGMSALGIINVLFTGGLALFTVEPFWFVIKEAFFPFILGAAVFLSELVSERPFFEKMLRQSEAFDWKKIDDMAATQGRTSAIDKLMVNCNRLFGCSFLISSALNYWLAAKIFSGISKDLDDITRQLLLNEQIAEMMWKGWLVIALPLMVFMGLVFWYFFRSIKAITGLKLEELTVVSPAKNP